MKRLLAVLAACIALPAAAQDKFTLQLNWFHLADHSPIYMALKKGYYKEENIDLTVLRGSGSADSAKKVDLKQAELGISDAPTVLTAISKGADLRMVAGRTDRVSVMYAGRLAEVGSTREVFEAPRHRYTHALLGATPTIDHTRHAPLQVIDGALPDPTAPPEGCRFAPRCAHRLDECALTGPDLESVGADHLVACLNPVAAAAPALSGGR